jgi:abnormal spindle-like microcephaly-associated protein
VLFTAFLCARLLEVSREERAAMVVQRQWRRRRDDRPGGPERGALH